MSQSRFNFVLNESNQKSLAKFCPATPPPHSSRQKNAVRRFTHSNSFMFKSYLCKNNSSKKTVVEKRVEKRQFEVNKERLCSLRNWLSLSTAWNSLAGMTQSVSHPWKSCSHLTAWSSSAAVALPFAKRRGKGWRSATLANLPQANKLLNIP